jgi:hypothetical protein
MGLYFIQGSMYLQCSWFEMLSERLRSSIGQRLLLASAALAQVTQNPTTTGFVFFLYLKANA